VSRYERALAIDPDHAEAHNNLGTIFYGRGQLDEAIVHYERVIALKTDCADTHCNLGIALATLGRYDGAILRYKRGLDLQPDHAIIHINPGAAFQALGRMDNALAHYRRVLAISPVHAEVHNNLGNLPYDQGRVADATAFYERALVVNRDYAEVHNSLGNLYKDLGNFNDAMAHNSRAIAIRPDYAEVHLNRSEIKTFSRGDADLEALESLARSKVLPETRKLYVSFALAKALEDTGDYGRAFEHLREGNALKRRQIHYDEASVIQHFRRISAVFDRGLFERFQGEGDRSLGRSGFCTWHAAFRQYSCRTDTCQSPAIHGAGELTELEKAAGSVFRADDRRVQYPEDIPGLDGTDLRELPVLIWPVYRPLRRVRSGLPTKRRATPSISASAAMLIGYNAL
jgi:tetratricopeptide (TPR) repeat protein